MTTKEQERKALEQIRKIVAGLGENSYVATAFEGCFEIAEENIDNDFACSMKQQYESARESADKYMVMVDDYEDEIKKLREEIAAIKRKTLSTADAGAIKQIVWSAKLEAARMTDQSAQYIVDAADDPTSEAFRQAVKDHRSGKKRQIECDRLIQRLLEIM